MIDARLNGPEPLITYAPHTGQWTLKTPLDVLVAGVRFVVPAGFITDLASSPRVAWVVEAPFDLGLVAPIVHDWLYRHGGAILTPSGKSVPGVFTRRQADQALYKLAAAEGVWWWRRAAAYRAVRWFGAKNWRATGAY